MFTPMILHLYDILKMFPATLISSVQERNAVSWIKDMNVRIEGVSAVQTEYSKTHSMAGHVKAEVIAISPMPTILLTPDISKNIMVEGDFSLMSEAGFKQIRSMRLFSMKILILLSLISTFMILRRNYGNLIRSKSTALKYCRWIGLARPALSTGGLSNEQK